MVRFAQTTNSTAKKERLFYDHTILRYNLPMRLKLNKHLLVGLVSSGLMSLTIANQANAAEVFWQGGDGDWSSPHWGGSAGTSGTSNFVSGTDQAFFRNPAASGNISITSDTIVNGWILIDLGAKMSFDLQEGTTLSTTTANNGGKLVVRNAGGSELTLKGSGTLALAGSLELAHTSSVLNITDSVLVTTTNTSVQGGTLNISGGTLTTNRLGLSDGANSCTFNMTGGLVNITGTTNNEPNKGNNSFVLGHYSNQTSTVQHSAGIINALGAELFLCKDGNSVYNLLDNGILNVLGINAANANHSTFNLGYDANDASIKGGRLNIGAEGIKTQQTYNFGNGTVGALASWSSTVNITLKSSTGTLFDTTIQSVDQATGTSSDSNLGANIVLSGILSGSGKLLVSGKGSLTLAGNNDFQGGTEIRQGSLIANHNNALGTGHLLISGGSLNISNDIALTVKSLQIDIANANTPESPYITLGTNSSLVIQEGGLSININFVGDIDQEYVFNLVSDNSNWDDSIFSFTENTLNNWEFIGFDQSTGNLTMKAIPEPTTTTLSLLGLGALMIRRRRK